MSMHSVSKVQFRTHLNLFTAAWNRRIEKSLKLVKYSEDNGLMLSCNAIILFTRITVVATSIWIFAIHDDRAGSRLLVYFLGLLDTNIYRLRLMIYIASRMMCISDDISTIMKTNSFTFTALRWRTPSNYFTV